MLLERASSHILFMNWMTSSGIFNEDGLVVFDVLMVANLVLVVL